MKARDLIAKLTLKTCDHCGGTGKCLDNREVGMALRRERVREGIEGREMARRLGYSPAYLCDLELGRRGWNEKKVAAYLNKLLGTATP